MPMHPSDALALPEENPYSRESQILDDEAYARQLQAEEDRLHEEENGSPGESAAVGMSGSSPSRYAASTPYPFHSRGPSRSPGQSASPGQSGLQPPLMESGFSLSPLDIILRQLLGIPIAPAGVLYVQRGPDGSPMMRGAPGEDESYEALLRLQELMGGSVNRGATAEAIDGHSLRFSVDEKSSLLQRECPVCLEKFEVGQQVRTLQCLHSFHMDCIDHWLHTNKNCPVCKTDIDANLEEPSTDAT